MIIPIEVKQIIERLESQGYEAYIVGGCVRDSLIGSEPHDWDICTNALPNQVRDIFEEEYNVIDTGIQHGTVTVVVRKLPFEITTFRSESRYSDHRHPDEVKFVRTLEEDLSRRDFKMNAIACNQNGIIIDPYNGRYDIIHHLISCVGDPDERFEEDPLRILRAMRFAAKLGYTIDFHTSSSMFTKQHLLRFISAERITDELHKMFLSDGKSLYNILAMYSLIITFIIPELHATIGFNQNNRYHIYDVWTHTLQAIKNSPMLTSSFDTCVLRFALLFHDIAKPHCYFEDHNGGHFYGHSIISKDMTKPILDRLKFSNVEKDCILDLIKYHESDIAPTKKSIKRWLNKIGELKFRLLLELKEADTRAHSTIGQHDRLEEIQQCRCILSEIITAKEAFTLKDLKINGNHLMHLGVSEGPEIGRILRELLQKVIDGELENDYNILLAYASRM